VAGDVVAEVDGPGEIGRSAVGVVGEAGEEASDAADGDAECEGGGVEIASGSAESDVALEEFYGDEAEGERSDDGFAAKKVCGVVEMLPGDMRVFEPEENFGAERAPGDGSGDDRPTQRSDEGISEAAAECEVDAERDDVGECFKEKVRVESVRAY
jgi:hypothetical protein